ncbi:MAG: DUF1211 domain-containing protein [Bacteroidales bacterium]|nr:DUF1211 domain-containing protein [Bacteroidales bacterium]
MAEIPPLNADDRIPEEQLEGRPIKGGFRLRGMGMTRLETFMDAAFAFATTMLVISVGEVPGNYEELMTALKSVPAFLVSFLVMMLFWSGHRTWSRRYGMEGYGVILTSIGLIFVLLVYIYPLRLMFASMFNWISGGWLPSTFRITRSGELLGLFIVYGLGLTAMSGLMALLYFLAWRSKTGLSLNALETIRTQASVTTWGIVSFTGLLSALTAWLMPPGIGVWAATLYVTLPVTVPLAEGYFKSRERTLKQTNPEAKAT